jgi:tetratricopeptide (TPR) repeat protein
MVPSKVELLCLRAQQAIAARDWETAKQFYLLALEFRANAEVHYGLATVYYQQRDMTNAAYHFSEVTRLDPKRARAWINLGAALHQLGELEDAEIALCKGLQLDGRFGEGFYLLGLVQQAKRQLDKALLAFQEALRCNPRLVEALLGMGEVHLLGHQPEKALTCYEQALRLRPNHEKAIKGRQEAQALLLARTASRHSPENVAEEAIDPGRRLDPDTDSALLAEFHLAAGMAEQKGHLLHKILVEQITPLLNELSKLLVNSSSSHNDLGTCLSRFEAALERWHSVGQGFKEEARKLEDVSSRFPNK